MERPPIPVDLCQKVFFRFKGDPLTVTQPICNCPPISDEPKEYYSFYDEALNQKKEAFGSSEMYLQYHTPINKRQNCWHSLVSLDGYDTWDHLRYQLEKKFGLLPTCKRRAQYSVEYMKRWMRNEKVGNGKLFRDYTAGTVLTGYLLSEFLKGENGKMLKDTEFLVPGDEVILIRKTLQPNEFEYTPLKYQKLEFEAFCRSFKVPSSVPLPPHPFYRKKFIAPPMVNNTKTLENQPLSEKGPTVWEEMSEDQKLAQLALTGDEPEMFKTLESDEEKKKEENVNMNPNWTEFSPFGPVLHALSYRDTRSTMAPPPGNYICTRCRIRGHWKQNCPTWAEASHKDLGDFPSVHGVPAFMLRKLDVDTATEEQLSRARKSQTGELFLLLNDQELQEMEAQKRMARTISSPQKPSVVPVEPFRFHVLTNPFQAHRPSIKDSRFSRDGRDSGNRSRNHNRNRSRSRSRDHGRDRGRENERDHGRDRGRDRGGRENGRDHGRDHGRESKKYDCRDYRRPSNYKGRSHEKQKSPLKKENEQQQRD